MPIYEYVCQKCERRTEVIQQVGERFIRICPHCGAKVKKAFAAPAVHFKGSGFYITDYARAKKEEKKSGGEKAEGGESKKAEGGESKKAEGGESKKAEGGESKKAEGGESKKKETKETKEKKAAKE
jgi:putative FmdB family regulatory protein